MLVSYPLQVLQCLSVQGLTSSGGSGSTVGGDGGNSSGASRAMIKDRLDIHLYLTQFALSIYFHL